MKRISLLALVLVLAGFAAATQDLTEVFYRAVHLQDVKGDLEAAIPLLEKVVTESKDPSLAAKAQLRIGMCYEKLGATRALQAYQKVIDRYPQQIQEVALARRRLAGLATAAPTSGRESRMTIRRVPDADMFAKPSPDGKYLAYVDWTSGNLSIRDVATGATRALTKDGSFGETGRMAQFSVWSRDSRLIVYHWDIVGPNESPGELRVVSIGGEMPREPRTLPAGAWAHDWSPDGSRILCNGPEAWKRDFALVGVDSGTIEKLDLPPSGGWLYQFTTEGDAILYSAAPEGTGGPSDIFLQSLKTGATAPVVQHPADDLLVGILPGTDWLFFASDRRGPLDLWAVRFRLGKAAGQPVLVKQGLGRFYPLGFTNDGRLYYATLSSADDVLLADFDRDTGKVIGDARKLTTRWDGISAEPSFSPDGQFLAYVVRRGLNPLPMHRFDSLVVQSLKDPTSNPVVVGFEEFGITRVGAPCWLPDGKAIVLGGSGEQLRDSALYRVDLPSLRKTSIYRATDGRFVAAHECRSDQPLVYALLGTRPGQTTQQANEIIRLPATGGNLDEVFRAPQGQRVDSIALSPDGRTLSMVTRFDRYRRGLLVMPADGGASRQILEFRQPTGGGVAHTWAPDGRSILYVQRSDSWEKEEDRAFFLLSIRVDSGPAEPQTLYRWRGQFFGLSFHPNGRLLAFTARPPSSSTTSEVWVIEGLREEMKILASRKQQP